MEGDSHARKRSGSPGLLARRRQFARDRIESGSRLTPEERQAILEKLALLGRNERDAEEDLDEIEYAIAHYWHLMAAVVDDDRTRLEKAQQLAAELGQALAELPHHYLAEQSETDANWPLLALSPESLRALEERDALVCPEPCQPPLRRRRGVRFAHQVGSRVEIAQYVVERLEVWAGDARSRLTKRSRGSQVEHELRWLLAALKRVWAERLGRPVQPQGRKRGSIGEFVSAVVAVADPHLPPATAPSVLRKMTVRRTPRPICRRSTK